MKIQVFDPRPLATLATILFTAFLSCGGLSIIAPPEVPINLMLNPAYPSRFQNQPVHEEFLGNLAHFLGPALAAALLFFLVVVAVNVRRSDNPASY